MINQTQKRSDEPVFTKDCLAQAVWRGAIIAPVIVLLVGIMLPAGAISGRCRVFERVLTFAKSFCGRTFSVPDDCAAAMVWPTPYARCMT